jgi:hypothetical protein
VADDRREQVDKVKVRRKPTLQESMGAASALTPRKRNMSEKIEQLEAVTAALQVEHPPPRTRETEWTCLAAAGGILKHGWPCLGGQPSRGLAC